MSFVETNWKFTEDHVTETDAMELARERAAELGIPAISPAQGSQLAALAAASGVRQAIEVGTGTGLSALWLFRGAPQAYLTSIDLDGEHQQLARETLAASGVSSQQLRLISGRSLDVLPRMNESSYDLVMLEVEARTVLAHVDLGLRLVRPGGVVLVQHVLAGGRLADPAKRDPGTVELRSLLASLSGRDDVLHALLGAGTGTLQLVRTA